MSTTPEILKKIGEISVPFGYGPSDIHIELDVAKNGMFYLVENTGVDAYGNPKCEIFIINTASLDIPSFFLGLVQVIGQLILERDDLSVKYETALDALRKAGRL